MTTGLSGTSADLPKSCRGPPALPRTRFVPEFPLETENSSGGTSELAGLAEAVVAVLCDNHVIQQPNPHDLAGLCEPSGDLTVLATRRRVSARMVVN